MFLSNSKIYVWIRRFNLSIYVEVSRVYIQLSFILSIWKLEFDGIVIRRVSSVDVDELEVSLDLFNDKSQLTSQY